jgi:hypothetical protein
MYVDFKELKQVTTLERVADWLGLRPIKNRMQCPVNQGDKRELVFNHDLGCFYCFGCREGGDMIKLAAHVNKTTQKQAAIDIQKAMASPPSDKRGLPEDGFTDLLPLHPRVQAYGLTPERAAELGIGYRNKGTTRDSVLFPFRDPQGKLLGYMIVDKDGKLRLPKQML